MIRQGAQGNLFFNDDTSTKILEVMKEIEKEKETAGGKKIRTGIFTTGIICVVNNHKIALFFSGRRHAGENMEGLMKKREDGLPPPQMMSDAKIGNEPKNTEVAPINCNAHARRYFVYEVENFPDKTAYVLEIYSEIFKNDKISKERTMSPEERISSNNS